MILRIKLKGRKDIIQKSFVFSSMTEDLILTMSQQKCVFIAWILKISAGFSKIDIIQRVI